MTHQIINAAFKKAESETEKDSINANAEFLSEYIFEKFRYSISVKSLTRYYKVESSPNQKVRNYLAQYLGYDNYETYIKWNSGTDKKKQEEKKNKLYFSKRVGIFLLILILIVATSGYIGYMNGKEECMIWKNDHYEKTNCTGISEEKVYNHFLHENFSKVDVSDSTTFFKNGNPLIWYDKSNNKLDFFTAPGIHPVNGKTLKPISEYMIEKYIRK